MLTRVNESKPQHVLLAILNKSGGMPRCVVWRRFSLISSALTWGFMNLNGEHRKSLLLVVEDTK